MCADTKDKYSVLKSYNQQTFTLLYCTYNHICILLSDNQHILKYANQSINHTQVLI